MIIGNPDRFAKRWKKFCTDGVDKLMVITDFDQTLTPYYRPDGTREKSSHGVLMKSGAISPVIRKRELELTAKYHPIETSPELTREQKLPHMIEWWARTREVLIENGVTRAQIEASVAEGDLSFRDGFTEIFDVLAAANVPTLIFSAGIYDVIHEVLRQQYAAKTPAITPPKNIHVVSNMMQFNDAGQLLDFKGNLIYSFNKNAIVLEGSEFWTQCEMQQRRNVLLLGDTLGDTRMTHGLDSTEDEIIRVGFLNARVDESLEAFVEAFDVVLTHDASLRPVELLLHQLRQ
ncbi:TPA: hypothetical protein N0F65_003467 [Lagenidium giganteum]|uniref:5'-nucleotidase n=1 Tax=Lagenidium giganteum TaxID=4803 RepID=A0AAV2YPP5_9STRA|nr:TPA: hypothetical protein N0F65_003467 [Lagenidium giganteum]